LEFITLSNLSSEFRNGVTHSSLNINFALKYCLLTSLFAVVFYFKIVIVMTCICSAFLIEFSVCFIWSANFRSSAIIKNQNIYAFLKGLCLKVNFQLAYIQDVTSDLTLWVDV